MRKRVVDKRHSYFL